MNLACRVKMSEQLFGYMGKTHAGDELVWRLEISSSKSGWDPYLASAAISAEQRALGVLFDTILRDKLVGTILTCEEVQKIIAEQQTLIEHEEKLKKRNAEIKMLEDLLGLDSNGTAALARRIHDNRVESAPDDLLEKLVGKGHKYHVSLISGPVQEGIPAPVSVGRCSGVQVYHRRGVRAACRECPRMIEFFFDCSSPWTWLAFHNLQPMARELGVEVRWRPILVGGIFNTVNPSVYEFRTRGVPAKQAYHLKDLRDWARKAGLEIRFPPSVFPVKSAKAMRGCLLLEAEGRLVRFATQVFEAYWTHGRDISQDEVLADLCARVGVEPARFFEGIARPEIKAQLKANTDEVIARGGFGSPTLFVDGDDMYFGNDRLVLVREAVKRKQRC